jgi:hypothetical protein
MKPCDCETKSEAKKLNEQGISFNEWSIEVDPPMVTISNTHTIFSVPARKFKAFAEWYIEDQV